MNRRGFLGLLSKLATVGTAMSIHPALIAPLQAFVPPKKLTQAEFENQMRAMSAWIKTNPTVEVWALAE
jgi:hypothetical protein